MFRADLELLLRDLTFPHEHLLVPGTFFTQKFPLFFIVVLAILDDAILRIGSLQILVTMGVDIRRAEGHIHILVKRIVRGFS